MHATGGVKGARYLGIDIGSLTVKAVLIDSDGSVLSRAVAPAGYGGQGAAGKLAQQVLEDAPPGDQVAYAVVTGYGRVRYEAADEEISEIKRRVTEYRHGNEPENVAGKTVIVIDDGLAPGSTMKAAVATMYNSTKIAGPQGPSP